MPQLGNEPFLFLAWKDISRLTCYFLDETKVRVTLVLHPLLLLLVT